MLLMQRTLLAELLAQQHKDLTFRPTSPCDVPLVAIDYILIPFALDSRADVRGIAAGDAWLSHSESRPHPAVE